MLGLSVKWMLCNLNDKDLEKAVTGPQGRGRGIVKAVCSKVDNASSDGIITITNRRMRTSGRQPNKPTSDIRLAAVVAAFAVFDWQRSLQRSCTYIGRGRGNFLTSRAQGMAQRHALE